MIKDKSTAEKINDLMVQYSKLLNDSAMMVKENCTDDEFDNYRKAVGKVMGYMFTDIMRPLYQEHPELMPEQLKKNDK